MLRRIAAHASIVVNNIVRKREIINLFLYNENKLEVKLRLKNSNVAHTTLRDDRVTS